MQIRITDMDELVTFFLALAKTKRDWALNAQGERATILKTEAATLEFAASIIERTEVV